MINAEVKTWHILEAFKNREYYKLFYVYKLDNLVEMDRFPEFTNYQNWQKLNQKNEMTLSVKFNLELKTSPKIKI